MTVTRFSTRAVIAWNAAPFVPPSTAEAARRYVQEMNDAETRAREKKAREHAQRMATLTEAPRTAGSGTTRARGPVIDVGEIYQARNSLVRDADDRDRPTPDRPRSLHDLAASYYRRSAVDSDGVIPVTRRGGGP